MSADGYVAATVPPATGVGLADDDSGTRGEQGEDGLRRRKANGERRRTFRNERQSYLNTERTTTANRGTRHGPRWSFVAIDVCAVAARLSDLHVSSRGERTNERTDIDPHLAPLISMILFPRFPPARVILDSLINRGEKCAITQRRKKRFGHPRKVFARTRNSLLGARQFSVGVDIRVVTREINSNRCAQWFKLPATRGMNFSNFAS